MMAAIKVENLTKCYQSQIALNNLNLTVKQGTVFGLLGANGAGKSTAIECILGTKTADNGNISVLGCNPVKTRRHLFQRVGVQFQDGDYQNEIKVKELCEETACLYQHPLDYKTLCKRFGIFDKLNQAVKHLSGGERQKLFIVLALIGRPELVFLDELTTGLDAKARREVWKILLELKSQGLTVLLTSHFMDEVESLCDEICILKKGNVVFTGTVEEAKALCHTDQFEDAYLQLADEEGTL